MKIAYLGPEGSYSHLAAENFLQTEGTSSSFERSECIPFRNFPEVLRAVESGLVHAAAVPIENSLQGGGGSVRREGTYFENRSSPDLQGGRFL